MSNNHWEQIKPPMEWYADFFDTEHHCTQILDLMSKMCGIPERTLRDLAFLDDLTLSPVPARPEWN